MFHFDLDVYSSNLAIKETTKLEKDNQKIEFKFIDFNIIATPGHTLDHIVYFSDKEKILFSGDTLFSEISATTNKNLEKLKPADRGKVQKAMKKSKREFNKFFKILNR